MEQRSVLVEQRRRFPGADSLAYALVGVRRFARRQPVGAFSAVIVGILVFVAVFGSAISPYEPFKIISGHRFESPSWSFPFGTDNSSRDILSRIIHGARVSIYVGLAAVAIGIGGGSVVGIVSGYLGGKVDMAVQAVHGCHDGVPVADPGADLGSHLAAGDDHCHDRHRRDHTALSQ